MGEDGKGLFGLGKVNHQLVTEIARRDSQKSYTLDVDATIIEADKEGAKVTYKGEKGYQPQMGFLSEPGPACAGRLIVEDEFREGNIPAGANAVIFIKKCLSVLPVRGTQAG